MLSDSISEGVNFQNFLGGHAPRPPYIWHALHASMCASYKMGMHFIIWQCNFSPPTFENVPTPLIVVYDFCVYIRAQMNLGRLECLFEQLSNLNYVYKSIICRKEYNNFRC